MHGAWFAHVDAGLRCSLVGPGLQTDVTLAAGSQLVFGEFSLVLLGHLRSERRSVETFVETLSTNINDSDTIVCTTIR